MGEGGGWMNNIASFLCSCWTGAKNPAAESGEICGRAKKDWERDRAFEECNHQCTFPNAGPRWPLSKLRCIGRYREIRKPASKNWMSDK